MENAAKALTIAGTILISLIVISAIIFMYRDITSVKRQESENQKVQAVADFNKSFESYNKELYGTELFSLANKIDDYNKQYANKDGYEAITLNVEGYRQGEIKEIIDKVNDAMKKYKSTNNLEKLYKVFYDNSGMDEETKNKIKSEVSQEIGSTKIDSLKKDINGDYTTYQKYLELKRKKFKCTDITYYKNGRIKEMKYNENK